MAAGVRVPTGRRFPTGAWAGGPDKEQALNADSWLRTTPARALPEEGHQDSAM
jgi:hypothetical protein